MIDKQQRTQWELEKKLEHLGACRTRAAALKRVLAENDRVREEILAIEMAQETMTELSSSIRDSFGLYLNKEASRLVSGITGGIYDSMSIDENLNVFLNTKSRLVPLESISSGAMDQGYLALRLAAARRLQGDGEPFPLIFDDSFSALDFKTDSTLRKALKEHTKEATTIIVAQRISTILNADKILVLDDGHMAGIGSHKELMKSCEVYRQIAMSQLSEEELT